MGPSVLLDLRDIDQYSRHTECCTTRSLHRIFRHDQGLHIVDLREIPDNCHTDKKVLLMIAEKRGDLILFL